MCIKGTFHLAVDTNYIFHRSFSGRYKGVEFKYVKGDNSYADCIVANIKTNKEDTYAIISELISAFCFSRDKAFIIDSMSSLSDQFRGMLVERNPGVKKRRMMNVDYESNSLAGDAAITANCPKIETPHQSNLARLYRLGKAEEYVNFISSFLFYYHIIDYPWSVDSCKQINGAAKYIDKFCSRPQDEYHQSLINNVESNLVFNKNDIDDCTLGKYIVNKVRHSVAHIIRYENCNAHNLIIDSLDQNNHFYHLKELMRVIARDKLQNHHGFDQYLEESDLSISKDE